MMDKKEMLKKLMKQYVDSNGCMDITKFRTENPNEYSLLPHYFGGIDKAIEQSGWVKVVKAKTKTGNKITFPDKLAYDMLVSLRRTKTFEQIAKDYGVSRARVSQLYIVLKSNIESEEADTKTEEADTKTEVK